jgi:hypothetical protein
MGSEYILLVDDDETIIDMEKLMLELRKKFGKY